MIFLISKLKNLNTPEFFLKHFLTPSFFLHDFNGLVSGLREFSTKLHVNIWHLCKAVKPSRISSCQTLYHIAEFHPGEKNVSLSACMTCAGFKQINYRP